MPFRANLTFGLSPFTHFADAPRSRLGADGPLQRLQCRLLEAQSLARPGFMTLRAVRDGAGIVDFCWTFVSAAAGRMLGRNAIDLYGKRLLDVLGEHPGREAMFEQYRRVVEVGAAGATQQVHPTRVGDGVAVTLINVSATRRAHALSLAVKAQQALTEAHA
jgi:PAS domain-containing protein